MVLKYILLFAFVLVGASCQSTKTKNSKLTNEPAHLDPYVFAKELNATHIIIGCEISDLNGEIIRKILGEYCVIKDNGHTIVMRDKTLTYFDEKFDVIWQLRPYYFQHALESSDLNDEILTVTSVYEKHPDYRHLRYDELVVFNSKGKIKKSFSFKKYLEKNSTHKDAILNSWTNDEYVNHSYERTHVNSFSQTYETKNSERIHTGYVSHCNAQRKIYLFDKDLKKVLLAIDTGKRTLHDVRQHTENELVLYLNENSSDPAPRYSSIEVYDLKERKFKYYYENKNFDLTSKACSSVHSFPEQKRLLIGHSKCVLRPDTKDVRGNLFIEFVDLLSKKSKVLLFTSKWSPHHARLVNASAYLVNNIGQ
jgi:hypothetical protein